MSSNNENAGGNRLAPRPVYRPPVDQASKKAFGRPDGVPGSFIPADVRPKKYRDQGEYAPRDLPPDPVLKEAFGRPFGAGPSLQRHPADAGALGRNGKPDEFTETDDPWRDPAAGAAL
ncbi:MAG: serine protease, partial [Mycolicibacter sinensis]